jgi:DNA-binding NtrC family response regulator
MTSAFKEHPRVFVVDDEPDIAQMMSVVLQMNLFDAVAFSNPEEALTAARAEAPDYLISDISMRGMTGIELAVVMQTEMPECKVLLFSGQVEGPAMIQEAAEKGHRFSFLQKPVRPADLIATLKEL